MQNAKPSIGILYNVMHIETQYFVRENINFAGGSQMTKFMKISNTKLYYNNSIVYITIICTLVCQVLMAQTDEA